MNFAMKKPVSLKLSVLAAFPAMLLASHDAAADFNYDYVEASYTRAAMEFGTEFIEDSDLTGLGIEASYSVNDNVVVGGRFGNGSLDTTASFNTGPGTLKMDVDSYGAFALYHAVLNQQSDYFVGGQFAKISVDTSGPSGKLEQYSEDSDSKDLFAGIRYQYNEQLEVRGVVEYDLDADEDDDEFGFQLSAYYQVAPTFEVGVGIDPEEGTDMLTLSLRKYLF